jgi:putative FmdB family regulatory protein
MPCYAFQCHQCEELFERLLKIADRDTPQECPGCGGGDTHRQVEAPMMMDPVRAGVRKVDQGFKEVLRKIHEKTPGSRLNESANF